MAHLGASPFHHTRRIGKVGSSEKAEVDRRLLGQHIDLSLAILLGADAIGGSTITQAHDLAGRRVDRLDELAQTLYNWSLCGCGDRD